MKFRAKMLKELAIFGFAILVLGVMAPRTAHATAISYTSIVLYDEMGLASGGTKLSISCSPTCNTGHVKYAVPPLNTSVSQKVSTSGTGTFLGDSLTYSGSAMSSFFNSAINPYFSANSVGMLTFNSGPAHSFQFNQDSGWEGFFTAGQSSYTLPVYYSVTDSGKNVKAGFDSTFSLVLYDLTTNKSITLLSKDITSGTSFKLSTSVTLASLTLGNKYELYLSTYLEQNDQVYAAGGSMYSNSSLIVGSPEPSTWILFGTGAAMMLGFLL